MLDSRNNFSPLPFHAERRKKSQNQFRKTRIISSAFTSSEDIMPRIYTDLQFRNQSSYTTSTSSSEFDSFGDRLVSSINMEEIEDQEWKHFPFFVQKICGVRIVITSTNANISSTTTYDAVISKHQTEPTIGLTLSKVSRNDKLPVSYTHLTLPTNREV